MGQNPEIPAVSSLPRYIARQRNFHGKDIYLKGDVIETAEFIQSQPDRRLALA